MKQFLRILLFLVSGLAGLSYSYTTQHMVGVMSGFEWAGGHGDFIKLVMQVSTVNKQKVAMLLQGEMTNTEVEFKFDVYEYDPLAKAYYKSVHSNNATLLGIIMKDADKLQLILTKEPNEDVKSPANYQLEISIVPQPIAQDITIATCAGCNVVKKWGIATGKAAQPAKTAASISVGCSITQGFNFQSDAQDPVGFVTSIKISTLTLTADFTVTDPIGTVPVTLSAYTAQYQSTGVQVNWTTQTETGNLGWNILRSYTVGGPFEKINNSLVPGAGTSAAPHNYSFTDQSATGQTAYYRLEQVDLSGAATLSPIMTAVAPPTRIRVRHRAGVLSVDGQSDAPAKITLHDVQGSRVATLWDGMLGSGTRRLTDIAALAPGIYMVRVENAGQTQVEKIVNVR